MNQSQPVYRFPLDAYPIVIEALHPKTRVVVWSLTIPAPVGDEAVYIPPLARRFGHPVAIRMTWANGEVQEGEYHPEKPQ